MIYNVFLVVENFPAQKASFYQFTVDDIEMVELKKCHNLFSTCDCADFILALNLGFGGVCFREVATRLVDRSLIYMLDLIQNRKLRPLKKKNPPIIDGGSWVIIHTGFAH
jgi:hypothetical protein